MHEYEHTELAYRIYVTESMRLRGENRYITSSWYDMLNAKHDDRTAEEIVDDVVSRLGGE